MINNNKFFSNYCINTFNQRLTLAEALEHNFFIPLSNDLRHEEDPILRRSYHSRSYK